MLCGITQGNSLRRMLCRWSDSCIVGELHNVIPCLKPERLTRPQAGGGVRSTEPLLLTTQQMINPERVTEHIGKVCHPLQGLVCVALVSRGSASLHHLPVVYHPFGVQQLQTPNSKLNELVASLNERGGRDVSSRRLFGGRHSDSRDATM